jgi:O-antigen ligase
VLDGVVRQPPRWDSAAAALLLAGGFGLLALGLAAGVTSTVPVAGLLLLAAIVVRRPYVPWPGVLAGLLLVILFIPIRRYRMPGDMPFQLEPYRVLVALILVAWLLALLADPRVKLRRSGLEFPLTLVLVAVVGSIAANPGRVSAVEPTVVKTTTFFLTFFAVFYLVVSLVRTRGEADVLVKTLVGGGAVIAVLAAIEARTGLSPFRRLDIVLPFLQRDEGAGDPVARGGTLRALGPAEHPIALSAALVLLVPFAVYLVRTAVSRWRWSLALGALVVGVLATVSRTGIVMLLAVGLVFLWLRTRETVRLWPLLLPILVVTHFAAPGTLGSLKQAFLPEHGLIGEQSTTEFGCDSSGRLADIGPTLAEVSERPFLGHGFGTRIVTGPDANACVLDNQWLGTLFDLGLLGLIAWLALFVVVLRRFGRLARAHTSADGWLLAAAVAASTAYGVGMLTYDAHGFIQVTFLLFILLALGAGAARRLQGGSAWSRAVR